MTDGIEWQLTTGGKWNEDHYKPVRNTVSVILNDKAVFETALSATPADVNMLWEAIDQLKARIAELEARHD